MIQHKIINFKKLQSLLTVVLVFIGLQANILPLALTFGEEHDLSFQQQSGTIYLVLGHNHTHHPHNYHHHNDVSSNHHHDHCIQLADYESTGIITTINQVGDFDQVINPQPSELYSNLLASLSPSYFDPIPERCRSYHSDQNLIKLKNTVQFLA